MEAINTRLFDFSVLTVKTLITRRTARLFTSWLISLSAASVAAQTPVAPAKSPASSAHQAPASTQNATRSVLKKDKSTAIVRGPRTAITELDIEAAVQQYPLDNRRSTLSQSEQVQQIAEDLLIRRELAAQAERSGLHKDPLIAALLKVMRERLLSDARMFDIGRAAWPAEAQLEAQARKVYDQDPAKFGLPKRQRVSHILFAVDPNQPNREQAKAKAHAALQMLKSGANFEDLAQNLSEDIRTKGFGGDLGYFTPGTMVAEFEASVDKLGQIGDISEPIDTQFGVHIAKLTDRRPAEPRPFEVVKNEMIRGFREDAHRKAVDAAREVLLKQAKRNDDAVQAIAEKYSKP